MNGFIISAVFDRKKLIRNMGNGEEPSTSEAKHQRSTDRQITVVLLLVLFLYLILIGPGFIHFLSWLIVPPNRDPLTYANFVLSYNVCQKLFFTNNSINFFLYCISGRKFRADLLDLLSRCNTKRGKMEVNLVTPALTQKRHNSQTFHRHKRSKNNCLILVSVW